MGSPISRYLEVDGRLATSAQPTPEQFRRLATAGFDAVVNLSTPTARNFLPEEARLAMEAGLAYVHAPVDCSRLEPAHDELLRGVLRAFEGRRVLVHCAGNVKSSALVQLWRVRERGEDPDRLVEELRALGWHEPKWFDYLERMGAGTAPAPSRAA
jgi:uncharacterized protein (TIGR01244 family)